MRVITPNDEYGDGKAFSPPSFKETLKWFSHLGWLIVLIIFGLWLMQGICIVGPEEQGVVRRFGKFVALLESGPHLRWPPPIEKVVQVNVQEARRIEVGFRTIDQGPPARYQDVKEESSMFTKDMNIISLDLIVQYRVADAAKFLFNLNPKEREDTVRDATEAAIRQIIGDSNVDEALTAGKKLITERTRELLQEILDRYKSGIKINVVELQDVHPPEEVQDAFNAVNSAKEKQDEIIKTAEAYQAKVEPEARGQARQIRLEAEAHYEQRVSLARGGVQKFNRLLEEYKKAPEVTRTRLLMETMERVLPKAKKFILDSDSSDNLLKFLPLETTPEQLKGGKQ